MNKSIRKSVMLRCMKLLNVVGTMLSFAVCWSWFYEERFSLSFVPCGRLLIVLLYGTFLILLERTYNAFDVGLARVSEIIYSLCLADVIIAGIFYVLLVAGWVCLPNPLPLIGMLAVQVGWNLIWSIAANKLYFRLHKPKKTAIVYRNDSDLRKLHEIRNFDWKFDVQKYVENPTNIHQLLGAVEGCEVIFVAGINATLRNGIAKYCIERGVQGYIEPHVGDVIMAGARHMQMFSIPIMRIRRASPAPEYLFLKRAFDIVASLAAIILSSPFMLGTALAIKLYDGGPILYKQVRLTKDRKEFRILKFRSMRVDAERDGVARLASEHDDRITPVGRFIRACRLDELPQLFNILGGSMSIVGPRPERPEIAAQYETSMPAFGLRLQVKAGLTGYAQIYGRYNTQPYDKLQMDLMYINNMSLSEDLRLMFATVKILFMKESTEGVEKGQTTAMGDVVQMSTENDVGIRQNAHEAERLTRTGT